MLGENNSKIPSTWPSTYSTIYNKNTPMDIAFNGDKYFSYISVSKKCLIFDSYIIILIYFQSAPKPFCATGRTFDLDAIKDVIHNATEFIHIAVMDYSPSILYSKPPTYEN
jgi:phospholipase D3/4